MCGAGRYSQRVMPSNIVCSERGAGSRRHLASSQFHAVLVPCPESKVSLGGIEWSRRLDHSYEFVLLDVVIGVGNSLEYLVDGRQGLRVDCGLA